jgi:protein subunit release factor B
MGFMSKFKKIQVERIRAGGPGGQNRNKRYSGVRITDLDSGVVVRATERRSQSQNLAQALVRLEEKLLVINRPIKSRAKSKPTRASNKERLASKKKRAQVKAGRSLRVRRGDD